MYLLMTAVSDGQDVRRVPIIDATPTATATAIPTPNPAANGNSSNTPGLFLLWKHSGRGSHISLSALGTLDATLVTHGENAHFSVPGAGSHILNAVLIFFLESEGGVIAWNRCDFMGGITQRQGRRYACYQPDEPKRARVCV